MTVYTEAERMRFGIIFLNTVLYFTAVMSEVQGGW